MEDVFMLQTSSPRAATAVVGYGIAVILILAGAFPVFADRPFEQSGGWIAAIGVVVAIVTTGLLAIISGFGQARSKGEGGQWLGRVLGTAAVLIVGLPFAFFAGIAAGLAGLSCSGGKIGEGCGGGSLLAGLLVGGLVAALIGLLAFAVATYRKPEP